MFQKKKENVEIAKAINLLENGQYRDNKQYLKEMCDSATNSVVIGNFEYMRDTWSWIVWKPTDFATNPEYKGESLYKVIPRGIDKDKIYVVLNSQEWIYP